MKLWSAVAAAVLAALIPILVGSPAAAVPVPSGALRVSSAQMELQTVVGEHFTYRPKIYNPGAGSTEAMIAHLNVASLTNEVYVDPEDWSSSRSKVIPTVPSGRSTELSWELQAVSAGSFAVYVVLLPIGTMASGIALAASPPVHVTVTSRRTLNAGGSLPVVIAVPALLAVAVLAGHLRYRRSSQ